MGINEKIDKIKNIPLREVLESYGAVFVNERQFKHRYFGEEKSPSGFIYSKGNEEKWKHFKSGNSGDHIDFVQIVTGLDRNSAINSILGEDKHYTIVDKAERIEKQKQEDRAKAEKDRKKMFAIIKNSVPIIESNLAVEYFQKRGIDKAALTLNDQNIDIRVNSFKTKDGKQVNNIVYFFNGNPNKGTHKFMLLKGIDENGNKNGVKMNLMSSRPVIHQSEIGKTFLVVEGIEDALSGLELGYKNFISLNSTSNVNKLIETMNTCRKWYSKNSFELCLDNDKSGIEATKKIKIFCNLADEWEKQGITVDNSKVIELVNKLAKELPIDYYKDFGSTFNFKESEYSGIMKELGYNDMNEMLVHEYKDPFTEVVKSFNDIDEVSKNSIAEER